MVNRNRWVGARGARWTDDATAVADLTPLSAQVAGHISTVLVSDFQDVQAGDLLAQIDAAPFRAQVDGMVGQRRVYPGEYVGIGSQVIAVVPLHHVYVIANYKETQLTYLQIGQPAEIRVDTFPDVVLHGHVASWPPLRPAAARSRISRDNRLTRAEGRDA
jgi:multidrug resistance efflux pump